VKKKDEFVFKILDWFEENRRDFPWRRTADPYKVLVAEMMLQKTTSKQVSGIFEDFVNKYPDPSSLSAATLEEIESKIGSLGIEHKRAVNFKECAYQLTNRYGGQIPCKREELLSLPGIGDYIANAVLCFACGEKLPLVDTNIVRLLERFFGMKSKKARARTDKTFWNAVAEMIPAKRAKQFNLGLLDFASLVCSAKNPKCGTCPLHEKCDFYKKYDDVERP